MADKSKGQDASEATSTPAPVTKLYKVTKVITYNGEVNERTIDALMAGARFTPAQIAAASQLPDKKALIAWYKANNNGTTHPVIPPIYLPFDHLAESALMLLIKRGVIAAA